MKNTLSLPVCRKLSEMGIEVESYWYYANAEKGQWRLCSKETELHSSQSAIHWNILEQDRETFVTYSLSELPALLRAIGEKKGEKFVSQVYDVVQGVEGKCLYKDAYRVAGPKPWGGGHSLVTFSVRVPFHEYHFLRICELYAIDGSLGEGSEASKYLEGLLV